MELQHVPILTIILLIPLLSMFLLALVPAERSRWLRYIAVTGSFLPLALTLWLYVDFDHVFGSQAYNESYPWAVIALPSSSGMEVSYAMKFALSVDGLSLALLVVVTLVAAMASLAAVQIKKRRKSFYIWFFATQFATIGLFIANDLLLLLAFLGVLLVSFYFLIGIWGKVHREKTATQFLFVHVIFYFIVWMAMMLLIIAAGGKTVVDGNVVAITYSSQYTDIIRFMLGEHTYTILFDIIFGLLMIGCLLILPIMPLHRWFIRLFEQAAQPVTMLYIAIMSSFVVYSFIRFVVLLFPNQMGHYRLFLLVIGLVQLLYGTWFAFRQHHFNRLVAYLAIVQSGMIMIGLATYEELGIYGAIIQTIGYSILMTLLLFILGVIYERTATLQLSALQGISKNISFISGILLITIFAIAGIPGFAIFNGQLLALSGIFTMSPVLAAITVVGILLHACVLVRATMPLFFGQQQKGWQSMKDARLIEALPMMIMIAFVVLLGVFPDILTGKLDQSIGVYIERLLSSAVRGETDGLY